MSSTISKVDLELAIAAFPDWLADEISDWVQRAESGGTRFASALDAVQRALGEQSAERGAPFDAAEGEALIWGVDRSTRRGGAR
jgi:predicted phage gp36 major capsid-like protein